MALETFLFDAADYITSPAAAAFLADAMESGDARVVADAIEVLTRASEKAADAPHSSSGRSLTLRGEKGVHPSSP